MPPKIPAKKKKPLKRRKEKIVGDVYIMPPKRSLNTKSSKAKTKRPRLAPSARVKSTPNIENNSNRSTRGNSPTRVKTTLNIENNNFYSADNKNSNSNSTPNAQANSTRNAVGEMAPTFVETKTSIIISVDTSSKLSNNLPTENQKPNKSEEMRWKINKKRLFEMFPNLESGERMQTFIALIGDFVMILLMNNIRQYCDSIYFDSGIVLINLMKKVKGFVETGMGGLGFKPNQLAYFVRLGQLMANLFPDDLSYTKMLKAASNTSDAVCKKIIKSYYNKGIVTTVTDVAKSVVYPIGLVATIVGTNFALQQIYELPVMSGLFGILDSIDHVGAQALFQKSVEEIDQLGLADRTNFMEPGKDFLKLMSGMMGDLINQKILAITFKGTEVATGRKVPNRAKKFISHEMLLRTQGIMRNHITFNDKKPFFKSVRAALRRPAIKLLEAQNYVRGVKRNVGGYIIR